MTTDDGGWMLIGVAQLAAETNVAATIVRSKGDHAGAVLQVYVDSQGCCASNTPPTRHRIFFADDAAKDGIRDQVGMGGRAGGDFDGIADRGDDNVHIFWFDEAKGQRATVISRARNAWWEYRDIYVK